MKKQLNKSLLICSFLLLCYYNTHGQSDVYSNISNLDEIITTDPNLNRKCIAVEALQRICIENNILVSYNALEPLLNVLKIVGLKRYFVTINSLIGRLWDDSTYSSQILTTMTDPDFVGKYGNVIQFPIEKYLNDDISVLDKMNFISRVMKMDSLLYHYFPNVNKDVFQKTNDTYFCRCSSDTLFKYLPTLIYEVNNRIEISMQVSFAHYHRTIPIFMLSHNFLFLLAKLIPTYTSSSKVYYIKTWLGINKDTFQDPIDGVLLENELFSAFDNNFNHNKFLELMPLFQYFKRHKQKANDDLVIMKQHLNWYGISESGDIRYFTNQINDTINKLWK